jgi:hypothetical protein
MKVKRLNNKLFKSGLLVNTVKEEVIHWKFNTPAYTFLEDDSTVEIHQLKEISPEESFELQIIPLLSKFDLDIEDIENVYYCSFYHRIKFEVASFTAEFLFAVANLFGSQNVRVDAGTVYSGSCDTCDYGYRKLVKIEINNYEG